MYLSSSIISSTEFQIQNTSTSVPPSVQTHESYKAGNNRCNSFLHHTFARYDQTRNDIRYPRNVSRMSCYLNLGIVSIFDIIHDVWQANTLPRSLPVFESVNLARYCANISSSIFRIISNLIQNGTKHSYHFPSSSNGYSAYWWNQLETWYGVRPIPNPYVFHVTVTDPAVCPNPNHPNTDRCRLQRSSWKRSSIIVFLFRGHHYTPVVESGIVEGVHIGEIRPVRTIGPSIRKTSSSSSSFWM